MSTISVLSVSECYAAEEQFLRQLHAVIYQYMEDPSLGASILCREIGLSRSELYRKVRVLTGNSVNRYIRQLKLERAHTLLAQSPLMSVRQIAFEVGFSDPSYFSRSFRALYQCSPGQSRIQVLGI